MARFLVATVLSFATGCATAYGEGAVKVETYRTPDKAAAVAKHTLETSERTRASIVPVRIAVQGEGTVPDVVTYALLRTAERGECLATMARTSPLPPEDYAHTNPDGSGSGWTLGGWLVAEFQTHEQAVAYYEGTGEGYPVPGQTNSFWPPLNADQRKTAIITATASAKRPHIVVFQQLLLSVWMP